MGRPRAAQIAHPEHQDTKELGTAAARPFTRLATLGIFCLVLTFATSSLAQQKRAPAGAENRDDLELFAGPTAIAAGNEFQCNLRNSGDNCSTIFNAAIAGGGFWPVGSVNRYVFNSGIQIAGIIGADGGPWAGDTTGAYFFDPYGTQPATTPLTEIYDSADPDDVEAWPTDARLSDDGLFRSADLGRIALSEQDTWVQYWEGDPSRLSGRPHPLGIRVTQRSLQWRYPSGNESVIYFLMDLENVSDEADFRRLNEAQFFAGEEMLPGDGYSLTELYVNATADMDVANAGDNFSTAILPFDLSISYHGGFDAPGFVYFPQRFYAPFFTRAPGIVGIKLLATPGGATGVEPGATMWTGFTGSSVGFPPPRGSEQLWRYMAGRLDPSRGDLPCSVPAQIEGATPATVVRSVCHVDDTALDTRFMIASGPFDLEADETRTLALAYVVAPTLETLPDGTLTGVSANDPDDSANAPGVPSFHPGFPSARGCADESATDCTDVDAVNPVRPIERAAGWVTYGGPPAATALESPGQKLDQFAVETATHSLLDRALVAQTIFDAKFLRPMPPEPPPFHLLPGTEAVTVLWEPSPTDEIGDPYYELAADSSSALFNPNYRRFDVRAYEIWKGTSADELELLAVFSHRDRPFVDTTCELVRPGEDIGNGAGPGYAIGETCPEDYERTERFVPFFNNGMPGGRPGRGVVRAASGGAVLTDSLGGLPLPEWTEEGVGGSGEVPFVYRDTEVVNNFSYFYAVTAVDLNSPASGPPVQRSKRLVKTVLPRRDAPNLVNAEIEVSVIGDDGVSLEIPSFFDADVDRETGIFGGPFPPTDAFAQTFAPVVPQLIPEFELRVIIDSIVARASGNLASGTQEFPPSASGWCEEVGPGGRTSSPFGACWDMYLTVTRDGTVRSIRADGYSPWWTAFDEPGIVEFSVTDEGIAYDEAALDAFGMPEGAASAQLTARAGEAIANAAAEGAQNRRFRTFHGGARWFVGNSAEGAVNTTADPARYRRVGHLPGVDTIFAPIAYTPSDANDTSPWDDGSIQFEKQCFSRAMAFLDRAADLVFTWQPGGRLAVRDATHRVDVPFSSRAEASWGFLTTDANGNGVIDWHDFNYIEGALPIVRQVDGGDCNAADDTRFDPVGSARPVPLSPTAERVPTSRAGMDLAVDLEEAAPLPQTGSGFGLYVTGHRFIFELPSIPTAGTQWTLRSYTGTLETGFPRERDTDPSGYHLNPDPGGGLHFELFGTTMVPGLTFRFRRADGPLATSFPELDAIHTVPDPYLRRSAYDGGSRTDKELVFVNLPPRATIRIYSLGGTLVDVVDHDDPTGGGRTPWDLRNRSGQLVASGVYFWHVVTPQGEERVGKFTIINPHRD